MRSRRLCQGVDLGCMVHQNADSRPIGQLHEMGQFGGADDLIGDQDVGDARIDEQAGFADFLATYSDGAQRHLAQCDLRAFVAFGVGA